MDKTSYLYSKIKELYNKNSQKTGAEWSDASEVIEELANLLARNLVDFFGQFFSDADYLDVMLPQINSIDVPKNIDEFFEFEKEVRLVGSMLRDLYDLYINEFQATLFNLDVKERLQYASFLSLRRSPHNVWIGYIGKNIEQISAAVDYQLKAGNIQPQTVSLFIKEAFLDDADLSDFLPLTSAGKHLDECLQLIDETMLVEKH